MLFLGAAFFAFAARRRRGLGAGGVLAVLVMALGAGGALAQTAPAVDPGLPKAKSARPAKAKAPAKKKPAPKDTSATATPASAAPEAAMPVRVDSAPAPAPAVPPASVEAARPASAPRREGQRTKVAVLPLECGPGVQKELAAVITDAIASALAERKELEVTSARDVAARLGFERQRAVLGVSNCADDLQCMVEIGNALGVDKIAFGSVARLGSSAVLSTTVVRLQGSDVVRHTERVKALTEEGFLDAIPPTVDALFPRAAASGVAGEAAGEVNGGPSELDGTRLALTVRGQMAPLNLPLGAIVAHLDWSFSEAWSAGVGAIIARPFGVMARGTWVPFNASGRVRPLVSLEVPVLFASSPAVGVGAALGFEWRIVRNLAVGLEVPVSYYLLAPDGTQRLWLFGAVTLTGRL
jgi:TolB-like protein